MQIVGVTLVSLQELVNEKWNEFLLIKKAKKKKKKNGLKSYWAFMRLEKRPVLWTFCPCRGPKLRDNDNLSCQAGAYLPFRSFLWMSCLTAAYLVWWYVCHVILADAFLNYTPTSFMFWFKFFLFLYILML